MAILATEKVLTHNYWKPAYKIEVGDYLFDHNGKPTKVTLVQQYHTQDCYRVTLSDGLTISGDKNLAFPTENPKYRNRLQTYKGFFKFRRPLRPMSIEALQSTSLKIKDKELAYSIPSTKPLALPHQDLPVPPFVFGYWFMNKNATNHIRSPKAYKDIIPQKLKDRGYLITQQRCHKTHRMVYSTEPRVEMQLIGKIPTSIPDNYLLGSVDQRIDLLSGILYAKRGWYNLKNDRFNITLKSYQLIRQIQGLVESLGIKTTMYYREDNNEYIFSFRSRLQLMDHQVSPKIKVHQARRYIANIKQIEPQLCVHIETEGADKSFLAGEGFIACL